MCALCGVAGCPCFARAPLHPTRCDVLSVVRQPTPAFSGVVAAHYWGSFFVVWCAHPLTLSGWWCAPLNKLTATRATYATRAGGQVFCQISFIVWSTHPTRATRALCQVLYQFRSNPAYHSSALPTFRGSTWGVCRVFNYGRIDTIQNDSVVLSLLVSRVGFTGTDDIPFVYQDS